MWSFEPVKAWRAWRWDGAELYGVRQAWPGPDLVAECQHCPEAPGFFCACGIYAVKSRSDLSGFGPLDRSGVVVGRVELTGVVIEHEKGYRAQRARIVDLSAPDVTMGMALKDRYGCVVRVDDPEFWKRAGLYG
jgi:hypothetical protein